MSFRAVEPGDIQAKELTVSVRVPTATKGAASALRRFVGMRGKGDEEKKLLDGVSAEMPRGSVTAILGASGSGKTTFLNVMASRLHGRDIHTSGSTLFNGADDISAVSSAYVMQSDVLEPCLTVRETLRYSAELRLPSDVKREERERVVEEVIAELGLKDAAETRIGNHAHKGCSGGEKRRTSIGVQLLANPSCVFLDEPTTGLDATSAFQLVTTLRNLSRKGRTIIMTIHQPRSEIWALVDRVVLLARGSPAFAGPTADCLAHFSSLGYPLPTYMNPSEHLIDVLAIDLRSEDLEEKSSARVQDIITKWKEKGSLDATEKFLRANIDQNVEPVKNNNSRSSFMRQLRVMTARTTIVTLRDPMGMLGSIMEAFFMSIVTGWIFYQLDGSQAGIRSRQGGLYTASALQSYLVLLYETYRLTIDIQVFDRERVEGVVGVPAFILSRRAAKLLTEDLPVNLIFSLIFYFMAGFRAGAFPIFFSVILLEHFVMLATALFCVAISRDYAIASLVCNCVYTLNAVTNGYFINVATIPVYVRWTKWLAFLFYAFTALCENEFKGQFYDCPEPGESSNPACQAYVGDNILDLLSVPGNWRWRPLLVLVSFVLGTYLVAGILLYLIKTEMKMSRARPREKDDLVGKEKAEIAAHGDVPTVKIDLDRYTVDLHKRNLGLRGFKSQELSILKPVTAAFKPGILNVIMGPSGSGKTTLLNAMAGRLNNSATTTYRFDGDMLLNGTSPAGIVQQSVISYVTQDDDALLPSLTVRETLRFAAGLRLPSWMSKAAKNERAEEVLMKMGLKACADNLIGSETVKGISGGEKRRVTIATQILTEPRILLLDEPTSGLDAFTASSIIDVLRSLAEEGRTLVLTIHQSRSDLWQAFGQVLLLARGGHTVYAGPRETILQHFSTQGYDCPRETNPSDFALDLITVDLQQADREAATKAKVTTLIQTWSETSPSPLNRTATTTSELPAEFGSLSKSSAPFTTAFPILAHRSIINFRRQPPLVIARIMQVVAYGIIMALYFAPLRHGYRNIQNWLGFIQEVAPLYFIGMLQNIAVYPAERDVFYREYGDGAYGVEAFFLQYTLLEVPFEVVSGLLFSVFYCVVVDVRRTVGMFFVVAFNAFCITSCGESLGMIFNTLFSHTGFAVNLTSVFLSLAQIMSGIMSISMPSFLRAMNYLSPAKFVVGNVAPYALRGQVFSCDPAQMLPNGRCPLQTGEEILQLYRLDVDPRWQVVGLAACMVVYRGVAYLLLKAAREGWGRRGVG
ncbi:P-loop containing nucleoside triphosphate hydrolase protein, partial [Aulographum hederae CBS 113979]